MFYSLLPNLLIQQTETLFWFCFIQSRFENSNLRVLIQVKMKIISLVALHYTLIFTSVIFSNDIVTQLWQTVKMRETSNLPATFLVHQLKGFFARRIYICLPKFECIDEKDERFFSIPSDDILKYDMLVLKMIESQNTHHLGGKETNIIFRWLLWCIILGYCYSYHPYKSMSHCGNQWMWMCWYVASILLKPCDIFPVVLLFNNAFQEWFCNTLVYFS